MTFINPRAKALRYLERITGWQAGRRPAPVTVEWDLSNRCYLGCQDCHFAHTHSRGPWVSKLKMARPATEATGDLADVVLVERGLSEMVGAGVQAVVWSGGGEPTTHPDWRTVMQCAQVLGLQQGMYTAGGLLTQETATELAGRCAWVVVSLDACDRASYYAEKQVDRFEEACRGIQWLAEAKQATVGVSFLLHDDNFHRAAAMLTLARECGATYATFRPAIRTDIHTPSVCTSNRDWIGAAQPILDWLATQPDVELDTARFTAYRDWTGHGYPVCYGVRLNTTITPDGRVWLCPQRRGMGPALGDLRDESFGAIWARHPGQHTVDAKCRVMCRLHPVNETLHALEQPQPHEAFV